jgi:hypothetical protein
MVEAASSFDVAWEWRTEGLICRRDPINDDTLKALGVVGSCARDTLLDLNAGRVRRAHSQESR